MANQFILLRKCVVAHLLYLLKIVNPTTKGLFGNVCINRGKSNQGLRRELLRFDTATSSWDWMSFGGPTARARHVAAWDPTNHAIWIHGGFDGLFQRDLWKFDIDRGAWELVAEQGPSRRFNHAAAWDSNQMSFWIHAGKTESCESDELWRFQATTTSTTWTTSSLTSTSRTTSSSKTVTTATSTRTTTISSSSTSLTSTTSSTSQTTTGSSSSTVSTTTTFSISSTTTTSRSHTVTTTSSSESSTISSTTTQSSTSQSSTTSISSSSTISTTSHTSTSSTSSTGTFTTSTSSTVTMTTTACAECIAVAVLCPTLALLLMIVLTAFSWWWWRYYKRKVTVVPLPPALPPEPPVPQPPLYTLPQLLVFLSNVEPLTEHTEHLPLKHRKASCCSSLPSQPDLHPKALTHMSIAPLRHVCIDIPVQPAACEPVVRRVVHNGGTWTAGPYHASPTVCPCKELPQRPKQQLVLQTPSTNAPEEVSPFEQPKPLPDINPQVLFRSGAKSILEHMIGDLPCLNLDRSRRISRPIHYTDYTSYYLDMMPRLEKLTLVTKILEIPLELPQALPTLRLEPCCQEVMHKRRPLRAAQVAPRLHEPAKTPPPLCSDHSTPSTPSTPKMKRKGRTDRDQSPGPGSYNPRQNNFGTRISVSTPKLRRRYRWV